MVLASKLREVRAQVGFTRLLPTSSDLRAEPEVVPAALGLQTTWLPATEVKGEGIFVRLDEKAHATGRNATRCASARGAARGLREVGGGAEGAAGLPGVRFYLLHSLSHLLLTALSLECGYAASAIRERICSLPDEPVAMGAILLATGSSGTEGTLGGTGRAGAPRRPPPARGVGPRALCSSDPVCGHHSPKGEQTGRLLEGAACRGVCSWRSVRASASTSTSTARWWFRRSGATPRWPSGAAVSSLVELSLPDLERLAHALDRLDGAATLTQEALVRARATRWRPPSVGWWERDVAGARAVLAAVLAGRRRPPACACRWCGRGRRRGRAGRGTRRWWCASSSRGPRGTC
ncbi:MAG: hypothetical protein U0324_45810 [Polyangiales bacterium]